MILKKSIPLWIVILCFMFSISSALALTINSLNSITVGIWESRVENTEFSITDYNVKHKGPKKVEVYLEITNTDSENTHTANVTVQLLDENEDILLEETKDTGSIAASGIWSSTFIFEQTDISSQYEEVFIEILHTG